MKNKIRGVLVLLGCLFSMALNGQVTPMVGFPNIFGSQQNQGQAAGAAGTATPAVVGDSNTPAAIPQDIDKLKVKADLELENKFMELRKQKILLEKELRELEGSGDTSLQDSINKAIKKKNLELVYLKEQMLLKTELERYGFYDKDFPPPSVFGQEYFRNPRIRMLNTPGDVSPSESYRLGSGDQVQVDVWGRAGYNGNYTVDDQGFITIPRKQKVYVKGKTLSQVRTLLRSRFGQLVNLSGSNFNVSVSNTRSITVHVTGEVYYPGTYTVRALNSAFNVLTIAGGPTNVGSLRKVMVQRGGRVVDTFDLYAYLFGGKKNSEIFLQNNDYLIVPAVGKVVSLSGGVRRSAKFELKPNEGFKKLLQFAGGFTAFGFTRDVVLNRIEDHSYLTNLSFNWDSLSRIGKDYSLQDGDEIEVKVIGRENLHIAKVQGGVKAPGRYKIKEGEKLADLIKRAGGLMRDAYLDKAYLIRTNTDLTKSYFTFKPSDVLDKPQSAENMDLEANDELIIFTKDEFIEVAYLSTEDFVRKPLKIEYIQGLKASDLIKMSGGIKEKGYSVRALIQRTNPDLTRSIIPVDLNDDGTVVTDVLLQRNDILKVYPKPSLKDNFTVRVYGEVNEPGSYSFF